MSYIQISKAEAEADGKSAYYRSICKMQSSKYFYIDETRLPEADSKTKPVRIRKPSEKPTGCNLEGNETGPGTFVHNVIKSLTGETFSPNCGCCGRIKKMNADGWIAAIKNASEIKSFMLEEAKKRGITADKVEDSWTAFLLEGGKMTAKHMFGCGSKCKK